MKNVCVEKKLLVSLAKNNWNSISNRFFFLSLKMSRGAQKKEKKTVREGGTQCSPYPVSNPAVSFRCLARTLGNTLGLAIRQCCKQNKIVHGKKGSSLLEIPNLSYYHPFN